MKCPKCGSNASNVGWSGPPDEQGNSTHISWWCDDCDHHWPMADPAYLQAFAACRRALTMAEGLLEFACICGNFDTIDGERVAYTPATCPAHQAERACKGARTAMNKAQGKESI